jgi:osmoprotectant transport system permease protein
VIGFASVMQTVPSLALFGFLIPIPFIGGIGNTTAIVALVIYALLPLLRNTYAGIQSVEPSVVEAGRGMGMTDFERLRLIEIPLSLPTILAGIRIATVNSIGLATIAAAVGAGGLGNLILRGLSMVDTRLILAGAVPAAALAILVDGLLGRFERWLGWDR